MLWLATGRGLYSLDPTSGHSTRYDHDPNDRFSLSSNAIKFTGEDKTGKFWVATSEGIDAFDRDTGKVTLHVPLHERAEISFYEDLSGVFWIIYASGDGLAVLDRKTNRLTRYSFTGRKSSETTNTGVRGILESRDGALWFGTLGNGLLKLDPQRRRFIRYRNDSGDLESLAQDSLTGLFEDREGNIWVSLYMMAPNRFAARPPLFEKFHHEPGNANSLSETMVSAIFEDRKGILWISSTGALNRVDRKTGRYTVYRIAGSGVNTDVISMIEDRSGVFWVGTAGHGLNTFDRRTGRFKSYRHSPTDRFSLSNNYVTRLLIDHAGTLWATTFDGFDRFDPATSRFTSYRLDVQDMQDTAEIYIEIQEDQQGTLWLGTHASGLQRFDPESGVFMVYKHNASDSTTLSDNRVNSVHFDRSGVIWVGTQNGLDKFDPQTGRFTAYYEGDGLPGNLVSCILDDDRGHLWMSTNNGLSRFDPVSKTFRNYAAADGIPGDLSGWNSCSKSASGEMFFGGFSGGIAFHPDRVADSSYVPPMVLTEFRLFGTPVALKAGSPLKKSITHTDAITLSHIQNIFTIEFSALSYFSAPTNRYRYKLEGLPQQWNEVGGDQRLATYTTLPAGVYTFRVQGATSRGVWSEPGAALRIEILPPWWTTWWFRTFYASMILLLVWSAYRYRLHQLGRQYNLRLEERLGERTRIAQELHDTLLQGFLSASMQLHVATDGLPPDSPSKPLLSRVLQLMGQVIEEGRNAVRGLRLSQLPTLDLGLAFSRIRVELSIEEEVDFCVTAAGQPKPLHPLIRDEVYRIGREALINAFRHSGGKRIEVELGYGGSQFCLLIRDDGQGIDPGVLHSGREGHWGLPGMRERAEKVGARLTVRSRAGAGTEVELSVPGRIAFRDRTDHWWGCFRRRHSNGTREGKNGKST